MNDPLTSKNLVSRLRDNAKWHVVEEGDYLAAADEIERLTLELNVIRDAVRNWRQRDRYRAALEHVTARYSIESLSPVEVRNMARDMRDFAQEALADETTATRGARARSEASGASLSTEASRLPGLPPGETKDD